ncbi:MAG: RNA polymerase sigma factor [Oscillospiraceae bacterium]|jgi:RNA polymerase sigma-70 factor (ECF subfamily)|nr:RNA polymerase sigma factor [Oscillospiraceae bacterium]
MTGTQLSELFARYGDDVYRFAYSFTRHAADAEDVCQSVFCRLAEGRTELEPGKEKAWLLACAANACKNRFRFLKRWQSLPLEAAADVPGGNGGEVLEAVLSLPEKYRAPVHLYYYEGYSQGEIADILGLRLTAVQTRMQRARAMLKEVLSDEITL